MKAMLHLGCTVPVRNLNYELSARKVAGALGLELVEAEGAGCCGFPLKSTDQMAALTLAGRVLAMASQAELPLAALCSACAGTLAEAAHHLDHDPEARAQVNAALAPLDLVYRPGARVTHFVRLLMDQIGPEGVAAKVKHSLEGWRFAPHYGCHYLKPSEVVGGLDDPARPESMARLIEATGAEAVDYPGLTECCGGGVLGADEDLAGRMAGAKLTALGEAGAHALVLICPFCNVMYEGQQKSIAKKLEADFKVPVVYLTQVLGLALGFAPEELGFKLNRMKPKELLASFK